MSLVEKNDLDSLILTVEYLLNACGSFFSNSFIVLAVNANIVAKAISSSIQL